MYTFQLKEEMKKLIGVRISEDLINKLRNIVYWTDAKSLNWLMEQSLQICVEGLEEANGGPFEQRKRELKPGVKKSKEYHG